MHMEIEPGLKVMIPVLGVIIHEVVIVIAKLFMQLRDTLQHGTQRRAEH